MPRNLILFGFNRGEIPRSLRNVTNNLLSRRSLTRARRISLPNSLEHFRLHWHWPADRTGPHPQFALQGKLFLAPPVGHRRPPRIHARLNM
jgi:hypothetical protein